MHLSSMSLFRSRRRESKQFAVIGLGRFGRAVCGTLYNMGYEVMGVDANEKRVDQTANEEIATHVLALDSTDPLALKQAGILVYFIDSISRAKKSPGSSGRGFSFRFQLKE